MIEYEVLKRRPEKRLATQNKSLVVEGFPRSGNTFLSDFIIVSQPAEFRFAHHTHLAENVLLGIDNNIPAIVLIRNPVDAVSSFVIYSDKTIEFALNKWERFYSMISGLEAPLLIVSFETIISKPLSILEAANKQFTTDLAIPDSEAVLMEQVKKRITNRSISMANREDENRRKDLVKTSCLPTEDRTKLKNAIIEEVKQEVEKNEKVGRLYRELMELAI